MDCNCFAFLRNVIGTNTTRVILNQSDARLGPIANVSLAFSRASVIFLRSLVSHWFLKKFYYVVIGKCYQPGFGFSTVSTKRSM